MTRRAPKGSPVADRLRFHSAVDPVTGCWIWQAARVVSGYGRFTVGGLTRATHRVSYETFVGPIPEGLQLDHLCRTPACINPEHLEPVTNLENRRRSPLVCENRTHCPRGHEYAAGNTYNACGRRFCRLCKSAHGRLVRELPPEERARRKAAGLPLVDLDAYFADNLPRAG